MKYLGPPVGASYKAKSIWDCIIEKMERRLTGWKILYLSKGGRFTLIKSILSNFPTYYLFFFPIPVGVASHMEKLQCGFLLGRIGDEFKFYLVNWYKICTPFSSSCLGVRNLILFT